MMQHAGVAYSRVEGFDADLFRCDAWRATLSTAACSRRWRDAQAAKGDAAIDLQRCRNCVIGAAHAGERAVYRSEFYGRPICPRCRRGTLRRMPHNRWCISCANRHYELIKGRNAKGTRPVKIGTLYPRRLRYEVATPDARTALVNRPTDLVVDMAEGVLQILRTVQGQVRFGFVGVSPHVRQGRLF